MHGFIKLSDATSYDKYANNIAGFQMYLTKVASHRSMSHVTRKPVLRPVKTNRPTQLQRLARALEFRL